MQPPTTHFLMMHAPHTRWSTSATSVLSVALHSHQQTCTYTHLILPKHHLLRHTAPVIPVDCSTSTHVLIVLTPQTTSNTSVTTHFLKPSPVTICERTCLLTSFSQLPTSSSRCREHTHEQSLWYLSAHDAHITNRIKKIIHSAPLQLLPPPVANANACSTVPLRTLCSR